MLGKRKRHYDTADLPPDRRFRANVSNLLSTNALTFTQAQSLIVDAHNDIHQDDDDGELNDHDHERHPNPKHCLHVLRIQPWKF